MPRKGGTNLLTPHSLPVPAPVPQNADPFLLEDLINLLFGENGIFVLTEVNKAIRADIQCGSIIIQFTGNLPTRRGAQLTGRASLIIAFHNMPAKPLRIIRDYFQLA
jgi:hypothetical protein